MFAQFLASNFQQGTNDQAGHRIDSCESGEAGSAQQMRQYGLGLIICGMRYGHAVQFSRCCRRSKKLIAQPPRGIFQIPTIAARFAIDVGAIGYKLKVEFHRQRFHETFIFIRFDPTKLVVKMQDENPDPQFRAQFGKQVEQSHRIRSPGNADTNAISGPNHRMPADGFKDALWKVAVHSDSGGLPFETLGKQVQPAPVDRCGADSLPCMVATRARNAQMRHRFFGEE